MNLDMRAAMLGQAVRAYLAGRGAGSKTPVAFLYNGVRLPKLPEWDKETYPYAVIVPSVLFPESSSWLYVFEQTPDVTFSDNGYPILNIPIGSSYAYIGATSGNVWSVNGSEYTSTEGNSTETVRGVVWANFDLLNADGTVYLAKSAPIPVYE